MPPGPPEPRLDERVTEDLTRRAEETTRKGDYLPRERAESVLAEFRDRFGPDRLAALDGEALLLAMHGRGGEEESLAYWLEFKNDELFPGRRFGSIAGGSAHKFGVYRRDRDGAWVTGTGISPRVIETGEAVAIVRRQRDQLLRGVEVLAGSPSTDVTDEAYRRLQEALDQAAPELVGTAWAHKYFFLIFPDRLDDYHEPVLQRYHLIRLLQAPPDGSGLKPQGALGRFVCAGRFVEVAQLMDIATYQLGFLLNQRHGRKRGYWRVGTTSGKDAGGEDFWPEMFSEGRVAVRYPKIEDLSPFLSISSAQEQRRAVREELVRRMYPNDEAASAAEKAACTFDANVLLRLARSVQIGDIVVACRGATVRGIGRITGDYECVGGSEFGHARAIEWLDNDEWQLPGGRNFRGQVITDLAGYPDILVETERHLLHPELSVGAAVRPVAPADRTPAMPPLRGIAARIEAVVRRKGQVILYGPPGTGKTHWSLIAARELAARKAFGRSWAQLDDTQNAEVGPGHSERTLVRLCSFHPGYGYEDFLEGYRPTAQDGRLFFELRDGLFKRLCAAAAANPERDFYLVIDEINRADVPRVFGELLTSIERDKRAEPIQLPLSGTMLRVPDNLYIIGTMNTADRSISLLDTALRRRFGFVELMPDYGVLGTAMVGGLSLAAWLEALNLRLIKVLPRDSRNLQIGHAYLFDGGRPVDSMARLAVVLRDDLIPLLEEYCYEDFGGLAEILTDGLVDVSQQRVRDELFVPEREADLLEVLETMFAELGVVASAAEVEAAAGEAEDLEETIDDEDDASAA